MILGSGPFTLGPGETREVLVACIGAEGTDRLDAITQLREASDVVQEFYDSGLTSGLPSEPGVLGDAGRPLELSGVYPNPFGSWVSGPGSPYASPHAATIRYVVARPMPVSLRVYDVTGRAVRTLVPEAVREAGSYGVIWDGRDDSGRRVSSGVYVLRLVGPGGVSASGRAVLLR